MGFPASLATRRSYVIALVSVVVLAVVLASCVFGAPRSDAYKLVEQFVGELNDRDVAGAAALTSYPNAAEASIRQMFDGLGPEHVDFGVTQFVDLNSESGFFTLGAAWNFGPGRDWSYQVQGGVRKLAVGWKVSWDPAVLVPGLGNGRTVREDRTDAAPPKIFDQVGNLLMSEQTINAIVLDPATMPDPVFTTTRLAKVLEPVAPVITAESMQRDLAATPGQRVTAVKLRDQDYQFLEDAITPIPGVIVVKNPTLISADRRISSPLLDPLRTIWQMNRDATQGWAVHLVESDGTPIRVTGFQGPPGPDIMATIDSRIQLAAKEAVVSVGTPAAIVVMQPSTGGILALDQNNQAMELGPVAYRGLYPAGQTLDLVRTAAALDKRVDPAAVSPDDLERTGQRLGLGRHYTVPGFNFETAVVSSTESGLDQVMGSQGPQPLVSPLAMALLAASIARGSAPMPMIAHGQPATVDQDVPALPPNVTEQLRNIMRDQVQRGAASYLNQHPGLAGMAAASGDDRWFFGYTGDLAFSVFVANADGGDRAVKMADMFLRELAKPAEQAR